MSFWDNFLWEIEHHLKTKEANKIRTKAKWENMPLFKEKDTNFSGSFGDKLKIWLDNAMLGDLDYSRQLEMLEKEMAFNSAEAEKNRQFNLATANTAFQRQAEDLQKAGYNPALVLGGSGSSVSSSQNASIGSHSAKKSGSEFGAILGLIVNSALGVAKSAISSSSSMAVQQMRSNTAMSLQNMKTNSANALAKERYDNAYNELKTALKYQIKPLKPKSGGSTFANVDYSKLDETEKALYDLLMK